MGFRGFKNWKSLLNIHILKGTHKERIKCFLYGRLTAVMMLTIFEGYASWYAFKYLKKEISFYKLTDWLKRKDRFAKVIRIYRKRKRKTNYQFSKIGNAYGQLFFFMI